jgi:hypothetical protein
MKQHDDKRALATTAPGTVGRTSEAQPDPARRGFLKAAPLGALAVVAAVPATAAPAVAPAPDPTVKRGYHETDHIRRYYQTAAYW